MIRRDELIAYLDDFLDASGSEDLCPNGLQVEGRAEISKIVTGVTGCVELFRRAAEAGAEAILVHHGIFWDRQSSVLKGALRERVRILLERDMTLLAYHLPLDCHPLVGNNALGGRLLGLEKTEPLGAYGVRGRIAPAGIAQLARTVEKAFGREPLVFPEGPERVETVGFCSGAAQGNLETAAEAGLDAYITGEVSLPVMHVARENRIHFLAAGHYATERTGIMALGEHLRIKFGLEVEFIEVPNPV